MTQKKKEFFEWAPKLDPLASPTWWARCEVLSIIYMYLARGYISGDCVKRISPTAHLRLGVMNIHAVPILTPIYRSTKSTFPTAIQTKLAFGMRTSDLTQFGPPTHEWAKNAL